MAAMTLTQVLALGARLGAACHGVVSAAELRLAGADPDSVKTALSRCWQRTVQGIYVTHRGELSDLTRSHVGVKHAGPGAVLTGLLAATWWRLRWVPPATVAHVLVAPERRRRSSEQFVSVRRCRTLDTMVTTPFEGLLLPPVPQVVVDGAREIGDDLREVRGLVLGAVADKRCSVAELRGLLDAGAVAGTALARRACLDAERGAASPPEAELVDGLLSLGVPFYCNVEVRVHGELLGVADVWLLGTGVGGELDSKEFHADDLRLDATLLRHKAFERAGLTLCHITPSRYRANPAAFHQELLTAVRERQAAGRAEPPGLTLRPRGPLLLGSVRCPSS